MRIKNRLKKLESANGDSQSECSYDTRKFLAEIIGIPFVKKPESENDSESSFKSQEDVRKFLDEIIAKADAKHEEEQSK